MKQPEDALFARLRNAHGMGLLSADVLGLAYQWADFVLRLEGGQTANAAEFLQNERERTQNFSGGKTLANDELGYKVITLLSLLTHPCQKCAEDPSAWHTRPAFCEHKPKGLKECDHSWMEGGVYCGKCGTTRISTTKSKQPSEPAPCIHEWYEIEMHPEGHTHQCLKCGLTGRGRSDE